MKTEQKYIGNTNQLFEVKNYRFCGGKADGILGTDVDNGTGLRFSVLADRCMDLYKVSYKGINTSFLSSVGAVAPTYFDEHGMGMFKSFAPGFLTTCGLQNIGSPCICDGKEYGLHGNIGNCPADRYCTLVSDEGDAVTLQGTMQEGQMFAENLTLNRSISCAYGKDEIVLTDRICNNGYRDSALSLLYHINIGYPLLSPHTLLILPTRKVVARDTYAALHQNEYNVITTPKDNQPEMCYYHTLKKDSDGQTLVGAYEPTLKIGFYVTFSTAFLNHFVQWKSMGSGEYVLGLEPCSCTIEGCNHAREDGTLQHLAKGASLTNTLHFTWFCGDDAYEELVRRINTFL